MLICGDCGIVFERPERVIEQHGLDTPPYEEYDACPACYGMCILDAMVCDCCDGFIDSAYVQIESGERYCAECYTVRNTMER